MRLHSRGRFNVKRWGRALDDRLRGTPLDRALRRARRDGRHDFVFAWNRGLGDVALGLVPVFARIRAVDPTSRIIVFTRAELREVFQLTGADDVHVVPRLERGTPLDLARAAAEMGIALPLGATLFADPDLTRWLEGRRHDHPPVLRWDPAWSARADLLVPPASAGEITIGAHVSSETAQYYGYVKDWPAASWHELISRFPPTRKVRWLLFGQAAEFRFPQPNVVDLRGRTSFLDLVAAIRARCRVLIAPDSGVLAAAYYLAEAFPLEVISLWSDPRQGILKQGSASPNPLLHHVPLQGRGEDVRNLDVEAVGRALAAALSAASVTSS